MLEHAIRVDGGLVRGVPDENGAGTVFRGIPFATPPTGELRWRPPAPVREWTGELLCDRFGPACMQPMVPRDGLMALFSFADPPECGVSEDCLYLNVWTCAEDPAERRPVIFYVFGGGNRVGAGSHPVSRGHNLARRGAVVVTVNYRLGPLGFLAHPALTAEQGTSGNYAGQDLVAALGWVRRNIARFGGDPDCVTLVGQSAGAGHVQSLMASPQARGLFHRAVGSSGGRFAAEAYGYGMETLAQAEDKSRAVLEKAGVQDLEGMRNHPVDQLYGPRNFWEIIADGHFLPETSQAAFEAGHQADVPFLAGFNADEASPYPAPHLWSRQALAEDLRRQFGPDRAAELLSLYPVADDADAKRTAYRLRTEGGFTWQAWQWAVSHARTAAAPTWLARYEQPLALPADARFRQPPPPGGYGAFHGSELFYLFDTLDTRPDWPWTEQDRAVADLCATTLLTFARTGDPRHEGLPSWPRFTGPEGAAMHFSPTPFAGPLEEQPRLAAFSRLFADQAERAEQAEQATATATVTR
ncbi:carboxylesterase family protein [Streptomyces sp. NPDC051985]|uniref:carboxylesterase/lipase family protein n=1 Tax=Streptomyces sp. NPDC051985 TaxID=3155807 RepID=UPI0034338879